MVPTSDSQGRKSFHLLQQVGRYPAVLPSKPALRLLSFSTLLSCRNPASYLILRVRPPTLSSFVSHSPFALMVGVHRLHPRRVFDYYHRGTPPRDSVPLWRSPRAMGYASTVRLHSL